MSWDGWLESVFITDIVGGGESMNGEEGKKLLFGTEHLLETAKQPFVGRVVYAVYPCKCPDCQRGEERLEGEAPERLHIKIEPLDGTYEKVQHQWYAPTKTRLSRWGKLNEYLEKMGIIDEFKQKGEQAFIDKVFRWVWMEFSVGVGNRTVGAWIPVEYLGTYEEWKKKQGGSEEANVKL